MMMYVSERNEMPLLPSARISTKLRTERKLSNFEMGKRKPKKAKNASGEEMQMKMRKAI